jgi:glycosyltransferase involved in cell wall biosynthesis
VPVPCQRPEDQPISPSPSNLRLNLAVVTETYPPEINGVAHTMRCLVSGLRGRGHQVHLIRPRQTSDSAPAAGPVQEETLVGSLPIPGYRGLRIGVPLFGQLPRLWRARRPDLVYIATQGPLGRAALRAARAASIPTLTGFHTRFQEYSGYYGLGVLKGPIEWSLRRFHNRSDATLVPTEELRGDLTKQGYERVRVFGRGVDTELFSPARRSARLRARWGCDPADPVLLYVGRIAAEKNIRLALDAFTRIQATHPNTRFVLVGDGPELAHARADCPHCRFVGARVGVDLARHYASADLFLFPSLTETFGNVVPEAMASGLAVVAFDEAAAHSYIRSGDNGILAAPGDAAGFVSAALAATGDLTLIQHLGRRARQTAEALGWDRALDVLEGIMLERVAAHLDADPGCAAA